MFAETKNHFFNNYVTLSFNVINKKNITQNIFYATELAYSSMISIKELQFICFRVFIKYISCYLFYYINVFILPIK